MIYLISVIIILILSLLGFSLLSKKQKSKQVIVKRNDEQQISCSEIVDNLERQEVEKDLSSHYDFEISSITQNKAVLDILITFINHSDKTTRVDLVKMNYFSYEKKKKKRVYCFLLPAVPHISLKIKFFRRRISNDLNISIYLVIIRTQNRMNRRILCESMSGDVFG